MAGVTANCKECGFMIFDEQTRSMLCDDCAKLSPEDRISGIPAKVQSEAERREASQRARDHAIELRQERDRLARLVQERTEARRLVDLLEEDRRLTAEIETLKAEKERLEAEAAAKKKHTKPIVPEAKSFLRKFDNLDLEGE